LDERDWKGRPESVRMTHFHEEIEKLKDDLLKMAGLVEEAIAEASRALTIRDNELAREVIRGDRRINMLENDIDGSAIRLLATQQPVAVDLRFLTSAMKINAALERAGDQAVNLAERAEVLNELDPMQIPSTLPEMATIAQEMIRKSLDAFVQKTVSLAYEVCERDDALDDLNRRLLEEMIEWMMREKRLIRRGVEWIIAGRHLERIGDEATNIAEEVVFLVEGRVIRHPDRKKCSAGKS
jgi:phosphate transport system protein